MVAGAGIPGAEGDSSLERAEDLEGHGFAGVEIVERCEHVAEHDADGARTVAVYGNPVAVAFDGKCRIVLETVGGALGRHG